MDFSLECAVMHIYLELLEATKPFIDTNDQYELDFLSVLSYNTS